MTGRAGKPPWVMRYTCQKFHFLEFRVIERRPALTVYLFPPLISVIYLIKQK